MRYRNYDPSIYSTMGRVERKGRGLRERGKKDWITFEYEGARKGETSTNV